MVGCRRLGALILHGSTPQLFAKIEKIEHAGVSPETFSVSVLGQMGPWRSEMGEAKQKASESHKALLCPPMCSVSSVSHGAGIQNILWAEGTCPQSARAGFLMMLPERPAHGRERTGKSKQACCVDSSS